ncbi:unnamed protein product, partial [Mycena citricolor]
GSRGCPYSRNRVPRDNWSRLRGLTPIVTAEISRRATKTANPSPLFLPPPPLHEHTRPAWRTTTPSIDCPLWRPASRTSKPYS